MKIHKVFPPFYNGITQQVTELSNDTYCKDMVNCVPDIVKGLSRRPPMTFNSKFSKEYSNYKLFHHYNKTDNKEAYVMFSTDSGIEPFVIYDMQGQKQIVQYETADEAMLKTYLTGGVLKAVTVQDRTWVVNTNKKITLDNAQNTAPKSDFDKVAYYWLRSASGNPYQPYNYAVYLDGVSFACDPTRPLTSNDNPPKGCEDSQVAAGILAGKINANSAYTAVAKGSVIEIKRTDGNSFTFDCWDSWGSQASVGFRGMVEKMSDLPKSFPFSNAYIIVKGGSGGSDISKDYYVKWNGRTWEETRHPAEDRGVLTNMPIMIDRISYVNGVATFKVSKENWKSASVGNTENNPDPSFVDVPIVDITFYKNRLAIISTDSITFSETAKYNNFYIKTALEIIDDDPIDLTIAGERSSEIIYVLQFDYGIYLFTSEGQYEIKSNGEFTIKTVQLAKATNYFIKKEVKPININNRIFFISEANGLQKLYSYQRDETTNLSASDLSLVTPSLMVKPVTEIIPMPEMGYTLCMTDSNEIYIFISKESGSESIQIGWVRWKFLETEDNMFSKYSFSYINSTLYVFAEKPTTDEIHIFCLDLADVYRDNKEDLLEGDIVCPINSIVVLPDLYPKVTDIKNPNNKMLLKKLKVSGTGKFNMEMYRKDYNTTYKKQQEFGFKDLNFHVSSKVGMVEFKIVDDSKYNFTINSVTIEGLYSPSSQERI